MAVRFAQSLKADSEMLTVSDFTVILVLRGMSLYTYMLLFRHTQDRSTDC